MPAQKMWLTTSTLPAKAPDSIASTTASRITCQAPARARTRAGKRAASGWNSSKAI
jgi:hypothetical protein